MFISLEVLVPGVIEYPVPLKESLQMLKAACKIDTLLKVEALEDV